MSAGGTVSAFFLEDNTLRVEAEDVKGNTLNICGNEAVLKVSCRAVFKTSYEAAESFGGEVNIIPNIIAGITGSFVFFVFSNFNIIVAIKLVGSVFSLVIAVFNLTEAETVTVGSVDVAVGVNVGSACIPAEDCAGIVDIAAGDGNLCGA